MLVEIALNSSITERHKIINCSWGLNKVAGSTNDAGPSLLQACARTSITRIVT